MRVLHLGWCPPLTPPALRTAEHPPVWEKHLVTGKQVRETRLPEQVACVSSTNKQNGVALPPTSKLVCRLLAV